MAHRSLFPHVVAISSLLAICVAAQREPDAQSCTEAPRSGDSALSLLQHKKERVRTDFIKRGNRNWQVTHHKNFQAIHSLFMKTCDEHNLRKRLMHHQSASARQKWHRTMKVKYHIKNAGHDHNGKAKGLGLFAAENIKKHQPVYGDWNRTVVWRRMIVIPYTSLQSAKLAANNFPKQIVSQLFQWCEDNWLTGTQGLLCEMDDQHYVNHSPKPNLEQCPFLTHFNGMCAARNIAVGEELLEDYNSELLDNERSDSFISEVLASARKGEASGCPALAQT